MGQKKINIETVKAKIEELRNNKDVILSKISEMSKKYNAKKEIK